MSVDPQIISRLNGETLKDIHKINMFLWLYEKPLAFITYWVFFVAILVGTDNLFASIMIATIISVCAGFLPRSISIIGFVIFLVWLGFGYGFDLAKLGAHFTPPDATEYKADQKKRSKEYWNERYPVFTRTNITPKTTESIVNYFERTYSVKEGTAGATITKVDVEGLEYQVHNLDSNEVYDATYEEVYMVLYKMMFQQK